MTREEAIKWFAGKLMVNERFGLLGPQNEAAKMAIAALQEQEERKANPALTLEELREMDGEPVYTITLGVEGSGRWELCTCEVVTACPLHKVLRCVTAAGEVTDYELDTYGKTWLAYRRKPEEGTA